MSEPAELEVNQPQPAAVPEDVIWTRIAMNVREKRSWMRDGSDDALYVPGVFGASVNSQAIETRLQLVDSLAETR